MAVMALHVRKNEKRHKKYFSKSVALKPQSRSAVHYLVSKKKIDQIQLKNIILQIYKICFSFDNFGSKMLLFKLPFSLFFTKKISLIFRFKLVHLKKKFISKIFPDKVFGNKTFPGFMCVATKNMGPID